MGSKLSTCRALVARTAAPALATAMATLLSFGASTGCVDAPAHPADGAQHARCLPCVKEGDMPCIDVRVDDHTPRVEWHGTMYYFCSESCRREFLKDPEAFAALAAR